MQQVEDIVPRQQKMTVIKSPTIHAQCSLCSRQKILQSQSSLIIFSDFTLHFVRDPSSLPFPITSRVDTVRANQIFVKYKANQSEYTI